MGYKMDTPSILANNKRKNEVVKRCKRSLSHCQIYKLIEILTKQELHQRPPWRDLTIVRHEP